MAEKEYIERGALLQDLALVPDYWYKGRTINRRLNEQHTCDVVEVVHARWEKIHDDPRVNKYRCTNCKAEKMRDNYCPNCGAKMDEEKRPDLMDIPARIDK